MSTLSNKLVAACMVTAISMVMYGCGGGGSSSSTAMTGNGEMPMMCAEGQTGMYPDCMDPEPDPPRYDGPKTLMGIGAYGELASDGTLSSAKNAPEVVAVSGQTNAVHRAVDGTLTFEDGTQDDDANPNSLTVVDDDPAPDVGVDGWMGSRVMKTVADDANPEAGIVYTNIGEPTPVKLMVAQGDLNVDADNAATITEPVANIGQYTEGATLMGTFRDAAGTFTCAAGQTCTITRNEDDEVTAISGWDFESTDPVDSLATQAGDYLFFGAWLETTPDDAPNNFKAFANGSTPYTGNVTGLTGSATYEGAAAGMYATKVNEIKADGTVGPVDGSVMAGEFTAKARLSVNFGGTALAQDTHFMITGAIHDFMDGDQALDFMINLSTAAGTGVRTEFGAPEASASYGTSPHTSASWSYGFFGDSTADATTNVVPMPSGVAGIFDAHFANGHIAGGFGATR
ncbi:MAG: hypothetical protein OXC42_07360 [Gammaproteobacteria bacterium]|nr:hypothetical protein [Gammaproteobacteria bacterium]